MSAESLTVPYQSTTSFSVFTTQNMEINKFKKPGKYCVFEKQILLSLVCLIYSHVKINQSKIDMVVTVFNKNMLLLHSVLAWYLPGGKLAGKY